MTDWGMSGRRDRYEFLEVDPFTLRETGRVVDVVDGESSITWGLYTDNIVTANIAVVGGGVEGLVRVRHTVELPDGTCDVRNLATLFIDSYGGSASRGLVKRDGTCYSTLLRYTKESLIYDFPYREGDLLVDEVRRLVQSEGGMMRVLPGLDEGRAHTMSGFIERDTNKATALNTLAGWVNWQVGVDPDGYVTVGPYRAPGEKSVAYTFEEGEGCTYVPGYDYDTNKNDIVNRVVVYWSREKDEGDGWGVTGRVQVELNDREPFSYRRVGRHQSKLIKLDDPTSEADMLDIANRYLQENKGNTDYVTIQHVGVPGLQIGDVVRYLNPRDGSAPIDWLCMVTEIDMKLGKGNMCTTKMRLVG